MDPFGRRRSVGGRFRPARGGAAAGCRDAVFMLTLAAISFAARVLTGKDIAWNKGRTCWVVIAYAVWGFIYFAYSWAASGRTAGMALYRRAGGARR